MEEGADRRDDQGQDKEGGGEGTTGNGDRLDPLLSSPPWRIELLGGGLRLCHGDRTLTRLETRKAEALVAYLALHKHRSHPRDALARVLWPDEDPEATRPRLRQTLALARRTLEPPPAAPGSVLAADRAEVGVVRRAVATDVEEFEAALREAEKSPPDGDTPGVASWRVAALRRAVNLYKGDLLAGHEAEWIAPERDRLREAFLSALEALAGALAAGGDEEGASRYARRAAAEDPLRESSHALLMRLYAAAGRTAEAVRQYRELERVLRRDLDAEPSEATRLLLRRIQHREGHEEAAPPLPPLPQPGQPPGQPPTPSVPPPSSAPAAAAEVELAKGSPRAAAPRRGLARRPALIALLGVLLLAGLVGAGITVNSLRRGSPLRPAARTSGPERERAENEAARAEEALPPGVRELYEEARGKWDLRTRAGLTEARDRFREALRVHPGHALLYAGLADAWSLLGYYGDEPPGLAAREAKASVAEAERLAPDLPQVQTSRAWIAMTFDWDWPTARRLFLAARGRGYPTAHQWYSFYLMAHGDTPGSLREIDRAEADAPDSGVIMKSVGQRYLHAGRAGRRDYVDRAIHKFETALQFDRSYLTYYWLGLAYEQKALLERADGDAERARAWFGRARSALEKADGFRRDDPAVVAAQGHLYAVTGDAERAQRMLARLDRLAAAGYYVSPTTRAVVYTGLGEHRRALGLLEEAVRQKAPDLTLLQVEPRFGPLHRGLPVGEMDHLRAVIDAVFPP